MSKVISGISMSLDGFVTGPNVTREQQLGDGQSSRIAKLALKVKRRTVTSAVSDDR